MFLINVLNSQKATTHDLRHFERGIDYYIDFTESGKSATMTTALAVKQGDRVILPYQKQATMYYVEDLKGYWNDGSIQTMLLKKSLTQ